MQSAKGAGSIWEIPLSKRSGFYDHLQRFIRGEDDIDPRTLAPPAPDPRKRKIVAGGRSYILYNITITYTSNFKLQTQTKL